MALNHTCFPVSISSLTKQEFDIVYLSPRDVCEPVFAKSFSVERANKGTEMCGLPDVANSVLAFKETHV